MAAPLNQQDRTVWWENLHCTNAKWVIWKRYWHVGRVLKQYTFTYSVNAPVQCNVSPFHSFLLQRTQQDAQAIWLWLCPWRNHYLTPHPWPEAINSISHSSFSLSCFSHSLDKFIYMKDHSCRHRPPGKRQSNQWFPVMSPSLQLLHAVRECRKSIINTSAPFRRDWRDQRVFNYPSRDLNSISVRFGYTNIPLASEINTARVLGMHKAPA